MSGKSAFQQMNLELDGIVSEMRSQSALRQAKDVAEPGLGVSKIERASGKPRPATDGTDWRKWVYFFDRSHAPEWFRNGGR